MRALLYNVPMLRVSRLSAPRFVYLLLLIYLCLWYSAPFHTYLLNSNTWRKRSCSRIPYNHLRFSLRSVSPSTRSPMLSWACLEGHTYPHKKHTLAHGNDPRGMRCLVLHSLFPYLGSFHRNGLIIPRPRWNDRFVDKIRWGFPCIASRISDCHLVSVINRDLPDKLLSRHYPDVFLDRLNLSSHCNKSIHIHSLYHGHSCIGWSPRSSLTHNCRPIDPFGKWILAHRIMRPEPHSWPRPMNLSYATSKSGYPCFVYCNNGGINWPMRNIRKHDLSKWSLPHLPFCLGKQSPWAFACTLSLNPYITRSVHLWLARTLIGIKGCLPFVG